VHVAVPGHEVEEDGGQHGGGVANGSEADALVRTWSLIGIGNILGATSIRLQEFVYILLT
jgi:hypothetical protein